MYSKKSSPWDENNGKIYSLALQHSSPAMKMKLEGLDGYEKVKNAVDGIGVLTLIQSVCYKQDNSKHGVLEIVTAHRALATCFQHQNDTEVLYYSERFQGPRPYCKPQVKWRATRPQLRRNTACV